MKLLIVGLLAVAALTAAPDEQTFTGTITDNVCGKAGHAGMRMGPTDAECARACVDLHAGTFVLFNGTDVYALSGQQPLETFAGQKVKIVGTLDAKSRVIHVTSIAAAS
jgi:hypothetical protein